MFIPINKIIKTKKKEGPVFKNVVIYEDALLCDIVIAELVGVKNKTKTECVRGGVAMVFCQNKAIANEIIIKKREILEELKKRSSGTAKDIKLKL